MGGLGLVVIFKVLMDSVRVFWNGEWPLLVASFQEGLCVEGWQGALGAGWRGQGGTGNMGTPGVAVIQRFNRERKPKLGGCCCPMQPVASGSKEIIRSLAKAVHDLAPSPWLGEGTAVPAHP